MSQAHLETLNKLFSAGVKHNQDDLFKQIIQMK